MFFVVIPLLHLSFQAVVIILLILILHLRGFMAEIREWFNIWCIIVKMSTIVQACFFLFFCFFSFVVFGYFVIFGLCVVFGSIVFFISFVVSEHKKTVTILSFEDSGFLFCVLKETFIMKCLEELPVEKSSAESIQEEVRVT